MYMFFYEWVNVIIKNHVFLSLIFCCIYSYSMELDKSIKKSMLSLSKDIVRCGIQPYLSFQDIGRMRQASSLYNKLYKADSNFKYSVGACFRLEKNYYACTQALVHCAQGKDEEKFKNLWQYHEDIRNKHINHVMKDGKCSTQKLMKLYRKLNKKK